MAQKRTERPLSLPIASLKSAGTTDYSRLFFISILVLAAVLRLYALGSIPHGFTNDEAQDGLSARQAIEQGPRVFYPENNGREGLYINLAIPLVATLGNTIWAMRLPSAVFGILTVWLTYLLGSEVFNRSVGLWSALFVATSTWHLFNSRLTNRANLAPFMLALALYLVFRAARRIRGGTSYFGWVLLAGAVYGLGFHTYTSFRVTPVFMAAMGIYCFLRARAEGVIRRFWLGASSFTIAAAAIIAPLAHYYWGHPEMFSKRAAQVSVWSQPNAGWRVVENCWAVAQMFFLRGDTDWKNNIAGERELFLPVAILFAAGVAVALRAVIRGYSGREKRTFGYVLILVWLVVGAAPSVLTVDRVHALRASLMIPPVFLLAAIGAQRGYAWLEQRTPSTLRVALSICFVAAICIEPAQTYFRNWAADPHVAHDFEDWLVDEAVEIRDAPHDPPKYVVIPRPVFRAPEVPQVILYLTQTSTRSDLKHSNIRYVFPVQGDTPRPWEFCSYVKGQHPQDQVFCVSRHLPLYP
jgi:4-amino-4-deoxy-L-arabinose transferase-like glycosyltransferase